MVSQKQRQIIELRNLNIKMDNLKKDIENLEIKLLDFLSRIENNTNNGITYLTEEKTQK